MYEEKMESESQRPVLVSMRGADVASVLRNIELQYSCLFETNITKINEKPQ